jgi:gamma-glutamyltranspeptidase / glutathione hydrolase
MKQHLAPLAVVSLVLLAACSAPATLVDPRPVPTMPSASSNVGAAPAQPEAASGFTAKQGVAAQRFMVAAANPLATQAGYDVLKAGGSAVDAAVAVQMVLGLVEPQSSGIGGGAFLLHAEGAKVTAWDGREVAPAAATESLFLQPDGKPMPFLQAAVGGRAVGVPGAVKMLEAAHRAHGQLPWSQLIAPAIKLAEDGFAVSPRLHTLLKGEAALKSDAQARRYFYDAQGDPWPVGHRLQNPALALVLRGIAARGSGALHSGAAAQAIARSVTSHASNPGVMTSADLLNYRVQQREAICTDWKATYRVCGFPPPSSGHLTVMQILGMLEHMPVPAIPPTLSPLDMLQAAPQPRADWLHSYTEAARLAYADRAVFIADPDFAAAPGGAWTNLLDTTYLRKRAALIGPRSMGTATAGAPTPGAQAQLQTSGAMPEQTEVGTSHISIVDAQGRAVAMTTTIEAAFGARLMSDGGTGLLGGFLLNNQLTDFSLAPNDAQGRPIANRVQPGKRPRSSMSPTLVFDRRDNRLVMSLGSPGGAAIIHFTAKVLIGSLDWGLDAQQAINLPNFGSYNGPTLLEKGRFTPATVDALKARGHSVNEIDLTSGLQAIQRRGDGWWGGADPRREGVVLGD